MINGTHVHPVITYKVFSITANISLFYNQCILYCYQMKKTWQQTARGLRLTPTTEFVCSMWHSYNVVPSKDHYHQIPGQLSSPSHLRNRLNFLLYRHCYLRFRLQLMFTMYTWSLKVITSPFCQPSWIFRESPGSLWISHFWNWGRFLRRLG